MREHLDRLPVDLAEQGAGEHPGRRARHRDPSVVQHGDPVRVRGREARIVQDDDRVPRGGPFPIGGSSTGGTVGGAGTVGGSGALASTGSDLPAGTLFAASGVIVAAGAGAVVVARRRRTV